MPTTKSEINCVITPNTTKAVIQVQKLLGKHAMDYGDWMTCGKVYGITVEEMQIANELLALDGVRLVQE